MHSANSFLDTSLLGQGLRYYISPDRKRPQPFFLLVVGVWFAAPSTHRTEEHRGSLTVSVPQ